MSRKKKTTTVFSETKALIEEAQSIEVSEAEAVAQAAGVKTIDQEELAIARSYVDNLPKDRRCPRCKLVKVDARRWDSELLMCLACTRVTPDPVVTEGTPIKIVWKERKQFVIDAQKFNRMMHLANVPKARMANEMGICMSEMVRILQGVRRNVSNKNAAIIYKHLGYKLEHEIYYTNMYDSLVKARSARGISARTIVASMQKLGVKISVSKYHRIETRSEASEKEMRAMMNVLEGTRS